MTGSENKSKSDLPQRWRRKSREVLMWSPELTSSQILNAMHVEIMLESLEKREATRHMWEIIDSMLVEGIPPGLAQRFYELFIEHIDKQRDLPPDQRTTKVDMRTLRRRRVEAQEMWVQAIATKVSR